MAEGKNKKINHDTTAKSNDPINHPAHYTTGKIEVIDYIEDQKLPYHLGNAVKYISRAGKKDKDKTVEDLKKAVWYIERYIGLIGEKTDTTTVDSANGSNAADKKRSKPTLSEAFINTEYLSTLNRSLSTVKIRHTYAALNDFLQYAFS